MLLGMTYYEIAGYFIIYSFIGWCIEVVYHALRFGRVCNRGFLNGPVCPVYGFGVILVFGAVSLLALLFSDTGNVMSIPLPILYLAGMILTTFTEFMGGFLLDKFFHARWWDYRNQKFNLGGYICLRFSLIWGVGIVLIVRYLHPILIRDSIALIPEKYGWWILLLMYLLYILDIVVSALTMIKLNEKLAELEELRRSMRVVSNTLSYVLAEGTFVTDDLVRKEGRVYDEATEADSIHTLETKAEFEAKREAWQTSVNEKREALQTSVNEKKEALQTSVHEKREALQNKVDGTLEAAAEKAAAAKEAVTGHAGAAREAMIGHVGTARGTVTDHAGAAREAVTEKMSAAKEELEAWIRNFNQKRHVLLRWLFRSHPDIRHSFYPEAMDELRSILEEEGKEK
ncbi:MAG: hypothetical protein J6E32_08035 [Lachnospiraceae bacterium]|nr:hypothetical protein [Lachnospiraceae bacterium]